MRYLYFGIDVEGRHFADTEDQQRLWLAKEEWLELVRHGSDPAPTSPGQRLRLAVKETVTVDIYEAGKLVRSVNLSPDTTEI